MTNRDLNNFSIENGIIKAAELDIEDDGVNNFGVTLLNRMRIKPKFIGQVDAETGEEDTFGEMADRSVRCALWLGSQNVGPGDVVGICMHNHLDQLMPVLAALYIGAVVNPWWDYGLTSEVAKYFLKLTKPKVIFVNEENASVVMSAVKDIEIDTKIVLLGVDKSSLHCKTFREIIESQNPMKVRDFTCKELPSSDHPACLLYTSGSTGLPKAVEHSHKSLKLYVPYSIDFQLHPKCQTGIWFSPLCWATGIMNSFMAILFPLKRVLVNNIEDNDICRIIAQYTINFVFVGPSVLNRLVSSNELRLFNLTSVTTINTAGNSASEKTLHAIRQAFSRAKVIQSYGTTEIMTAVFQQDGCKPHSHGVLARGLEMKIVDPETGKILGPNQEGEACFKSPFMMTGYFAAPEATKLVIDNEGFYHSGDLAYYDEDEEIFIVDRLKELIKWQSYQIVPAVVEKCIKTHVKSVIEVAVVPIPHFLDVERPFAFVVRQPESNVTADEIIRVVEENLPDYARLRGGVEFLAKMPQTGTRKINRSALKTVAKMFVNNQSIDLRISTN